ncbi:MAG: hypothetical protein ABW104_18995, partial [Candidatus Thiodiazotropha sp. 6PLUC2]
PTRIGVGWGHAPPKACRKRHNHMQPSQFHDYLSKVAWMERSGIRDGWCTVPPGFRYTSSRLRSRQRLPALSK